MWQEKKEEEDLPGLKTVLTHQYKEKSGERLITATRNNSDKTKNQWNNNNQKTKIGRKTTLWTFQAIKKQHLTREDMDVAKKRKP